MRVDESLDPNGPGPSRVGCTGRVETTGVEGGV